MNTSDNFQKYLVFYRERLRVTANIFVSILKYVYSFYTTFNISKYIFVNILTYLYRNVKAFFGGFTNNCARKWRIP